jgi:hypothetical protein
MHARLLGSLVLMSLFVGAFAHCNALVGNSEIAYFEPAASPATSADASSDAQTEDGSAPPPRFCVEHASTLYCNDFEDDAALQRFASTNLSDGSTITRTEGVYRSPRHALRLDAKFDENFANGLASAGVELPAMSALQLQEANFRLSFALRLGSVGARVVHVAFRQGEVDLEINVDEAWLRSGPYAARATLKRDPQEFVLVQLDMRRTDMLRVNATIGEIPISLDVPRTQINDMRIDAIFLGVENASRDGEKGWLDDVLVERLP